MQGNNQAIVEAQLVTLVVFKTAMESPVYVNPEAVETLEPTFDSSETKITLRGGGVITVRGNPAATAARLQEPEGDAPE